MNRANNTCEVDGCNFKHGQAAFVTRARRGFKKMEWFHSLEELQRQWGQVAIWKQIKVVLTIAHLDHDETNWDVKDERLMAMCQRHHITYDAKEKWRRSCENWKRKSMASPASERLTKRLND